MCLRYRHLKKENTAESKVKAEEPSRHMSVSHQAVPRGSWASTPPQPLKKQKPKYKLTFQNWSYRVIITEHIALLQSVVIRNLLFELP